MRMFVISVLTATALVTSRSAMLAAPGQATQRPGEMTQARVWVENRDPREAVPVAIVATARDVPPIRVQVMNGDTPANPTPPVLVREAPRTWEYKTIDVPNNVNPAAALNREGVTGWETAGVTWPFGNQTTWLLKRPRS